LPVVDKDRNFNNEKLQQYIEEIESSINRYLTGLDTADRQEPAWLMPVSAYAGLNSIMNSYQHAIDQPWRFFSYGDVMFLL